MLLSAVSGVAQLLILSSCCLGGEPQAKDAEAKKYRELVAQLISPNREPTTGDESVTFPAGYDVPAQERIDKARRTLHANIEEALPYLIESLDDKRYSMTIEWAEGDAYYNYSVGEICRDIIQDRLEVYRDKISFSGPTHWNRYNYDVISKKWWRNRQGHSLADLQVEAIDWAIKRRKAEPKSQIDEDRQNEVVELKKLRDGIKATGKPVPAGKILRMETSDQH